MNDFESFSSYELTHDNKKNISASNGGCLSGCATVIALVTGIIVGVTVLIICL